MRSGIFLRDHRFSSVLHLTRPENVESILTHGLMIDREDDLYDTGPFAREFYGCIPVYASVSQPWLHGRRADTCALIELDVRGLAVSVDAPSLADDGCDYTERGLYVPTDGRATGHELIGIALGRGSAPDPACYDEKHLLDHWRRLRPQQVGRITVIEAAARATDTITIGENIAPERLRLISIPEQQAAA